jgi:predicted O-methyltransferase YrrM
MPSEFLTVQQVIEKKPAWVKNQVSNGDVQILEQQIVSRKAQSAIEIGVASGFSSAILFSALARSTDTPRLYSFDLSEPCYFNPDKKTGEAMTEIYGQPEGFKLQTGVTAADIKGIPEKVDFLFIDASHLHPWAALDLLSLSRFLKPGGVVALHDILLPVRNKTGNHNGPRDLYRAWTGKRIHYDVAPNLGIVEYRDNEELAASLIGAFQVTWEVPVAPELMPKLMKMTSRFGKKRSKRMRTIMQNRNRTAQILRAAKFPVAAKS